MSRKPESENPADGVPNPADIDFKEVAKRVDEGHLDFHEETNVDPRTTDIAKAVLKSRSAPKRSALEDLLPKAEWEKIKAYGPPDARKNPYTQFNNAMNVFMSVNQLRGTRAKDPNNEALREQELMAICQMEIFGQLAKYGIKK